VAAIGFRASLRADNVAVGVLTQDGPLTGAVEIALTAKAPDGHGEPITNRFTCVSGKPCELQIELPSLDWALEAEAAGYWSEAVTLNREAKRAVVKLWTAAELKGRATFPQKTQGSEVLVRFGPDHGESGPSGSTTCPIADGAWDCTLPAGSLDLSIRVRGHISHYFWSQTLQRAKSLDLGTLEFLPGASLVGRVSSPDPGAPKPGSCRISISPDASGGRGPTTSTAAINDRGFFHFDGLAPGRYVVYARQQGFVEAQGTAVVVEGAEASLKSPLLLTRPRKLEITLSPPLDPEGKPWRVQLFRSAETHSPGPMSPSSADREGRWVLDGLSGVEKYTVGVKTSTDQDWYRDDSPLRLDDPLTRKSISLDVERITGTVKMGDRPVRAVLVFGVQEAVRVNLQSDKDGQFQGALPRLGRWRVSVTADDPAVHREMDVDVVRSSGDGRAEIVLPDRSLVGEIVTEDGEEIPNVILTVRHAASKEGRPEFSQKVLKSGPFRLEGLAPGEYYLSAAARGRRSGEAKATVSEDASSDPVRLVLHERRSLSVRVTSPGGAGIVGASITLFQSPTDMTVGTVTRTTDRDGRLVHPVSPSLTAQCVAVAAPGLTTVITSVPISDEEQTITPPPHGGRLTIDAPSGPGYGPFLRHGGCTLPLGLIRAYLPVQNREIANLESGEYVVCVAKGAEWAAVAGGAFDPRSCSQGFLSPGAELTVKVTASDATPK